MQAGGTKVIQPFEAGIVRAIHVGDGQRVRAGDVLIELDPKINESDRSHLQADLMAAQLEIARLKAGLADTKDPLEAFHPPATASAAQSCHAAGLPDTADRRIPGQAGCP